MLYRFYELSVKDLLLTVIRQVIPFSRLKIGVVNNLTSYSFISMLWKHLIIKSLD